MDESSETVEILKGQHINGPSLIQLGALKSESVEQVLAIPVREGEPSKSSNQGMGVYLFDGLDRVDDKGNAYHGYFAKDTIRMGRSRKNDIFFPQGEVSRKHVSIRKDGDRYVIDDEGSTNGSRISSVPNCTEGISAIPSGGWRGASVGNPVTLRLANTEGILKKVGNDVILSLVGKNVILKQGVQFRVGRGHKGIDLVIPDESKYGDVSRNHATLILVGDAVFIRDNNSSNGTTIEIAAQIAKPATKEPAQATKERVASQPSEGRSQRSLREVGVNLESEGHTLPSDEHPQENQDTLIVDSKKRHIGVFDGMGGMAGGAVASRVARDKIAEALGSLPAKPSIQQVIDVLRNAWHEATQNISALEYSNSRLSGMGSTASVAQVVDTERGRSVVIGHSGDSRIYIVRKDGTINKLTRDANSASEYAQAKMDRAKSRNDVEGIEIEWNHRNQITSVVNAYTSEPLTSVYDIAGDDLMLLATSDGVHDNLTSDEIEEVIREGLRRGFKAAEISRAIVTRAQNRAREGHFRSKMDDITAVTMSLV